MIRAGVDNKTRPGFRPDIEGLRALAILPILFNHAQVRGFMGGFIGVDVFFVISGYLITGILLRDVAAGRFSIGHFYRRRVLRIFPALFATLALTTVVAFIALTPNELVAYAKSLAATVLFASNVYFSANTGYFAWNAVNAALLHTWSLAVEEQFYIFWPALIAVLAARSRRALSVGLIGITVASLVFAIWLVQRDMTAAFYLLPSRAWEFGVGALLAIFPSSGRLPKIVRQVLGLAGVATLLYCTNAYRQPIVFPGWTAVPPCLATAALIMAGPGTLVGWALSLSPVRFIGRISYSLYLVHWPIIVFSSLWLFLPATPGVIAGQIVLSIVVAWASYAVVETRGRTMLERLQERRLLLFAAVAMALVLALALTLKIADGFPARYPTERVRIARVLDRDDEASYRRGSCFLVSGEDKFDATRCLTPDGKHLSLLLVGDSVAAHYWPGLARYAGRYDVLQATSVGCPPGIYRDQRTMPCHTFFGDMLTQWVPRHRPDMVVIAGYWSQAVFVPEVERTLAYLQSIKQPTILIGPVPDYSLPLPRLLFFGGDARARSQMRREAFDYDRQLRAVAARHGATYISPIDLLCRGEACRTMATDEVPLQFDSHHLTREGSEVLVDAMMPQIDAAMRK